MDNISLHGNETQSKLEASEKTDTFALQSDTSQQNIPKKGERGNYKTWNTDLLNCNDLDVSELKNPERKRFREKRRRERVNTSFESLKRILGHVDSQRYLNQGGSTDMSQIEIVNSAITVIHQLIEENMSTRKRIIELQASFKNDVFQMRSQWNPILQRNREYGSIEEKSCDLTLNDAQAPVFVNPFENESILPSNAEFLPQKAPVCHPTFNVEKMEPHATTAHHTFAYSEHSQHSISHSGVNLQPIMEESWMELINDVSSRGGEDDMTLAEDQSSTSSLAQILFRFHNGQHSGKQPPQNKMY